MIGKRTERYADGVLVGWQQWPDTVDGLVDQNGTLRPLTADEVAAYEAETAAKGDAIARSAQRETAQSWLRVLSEWAQSDDAGTDPSEVALAVRLTVEAAAVLLAEPAD